jgi:hypothetical protein
VTVALALGLEVRQGITGVLANDLALPLADTGEDGHHQAPGGGGRVERLLQAHQGGVAPLEALHEPVEVGNAAGEAVELIDDDHLHLVGVDQGERDLQAQPLEVFRCIPFVAEDGQEVPILHQAIRLQLRLLRLHQDAIPDLILGADPYIAARPHTPPFGKVW